MRWLYLLGISFRLFCSSLEDVLPSSSGEIFLGSRESDPSSLVENVSTIYGDYTEIEVDLIVTSPDSLILSRFYSSRDSLQISDY